MRTFEEFFREWLEESVMECAIVEAWNEYCRSNRYTEDEIFDMSELDDIFYDCTASEMLKRLDSDFSLNCRYIHDSIYGWVSFDDIEDVIDYRALTEWAIDNEDIVGNLLDIDNAREAYEEENEDC